jgi:hypothetical protein
MSEAKLAVIYNDTIYHEGDERSRTHPGHGYPAYTETVQKFKEFKNEEELKLWIKRNERTTYKVISYKELKVTTEVVIKVE